MVVGKILFGICDYLPVHSFCVLLKHPSNISWPGRYAIPPQIRHSGSSHHSEVEFADCSCKAVTPAAVPQPDLDILSVDPWSSKEEVQYGLGPQSGPHGVLKNSFPTAF